ncbi:MAG: hypothetical protein NZM00_13360, partial [Anaerolinea sp.]|nr:hypothetical protein [Anaerolinea sp.]
MHSNRVQLQQSRLYTGLPGGATSSPAERDRAGQSNRCVEPLIGAYTGDQRDRIPAQPADEQHA